MRFMSHAGKGRRTWSERARMHCSALLAFGAVCSQMVLSATTPVAAAQEMSGCAGSWLVRISIEGRDVIEDGLVTFEPDGGLTLVSPPVVPPLPNTDGVPLSVSDGVGHWQASDDSACAFDLVRLLGDADGNGLGALYWRGTVEADSDGMGLSGSFNYAQSTPVGQTVANGAGSLTGTTLGPAVSSQQAATQATGITAYENEEFGFRLAYDPTMWQVQSQSNASLYLTDGGSIVAIGGTRALPTDASSCVDESIASLSVTSTRQDYTPALDSSGNPVRRDGPLAAYAISTYRDRSGAERFERVECRTLPEGRGMVTILQGGALADMETETANLESLLSRLEIE